MLDLYPMYDGLRNAGEPARESAQVLHTWLNTPSVRDNPFIPFARPLAATCELLAHSVPTHERPDFGIEETTVDGKAVAVQEEIVWRHPFCALTHFRKDVDHAQPKVLIVAPLSSHFATLLRGTVKTFLHDHDVYITDWKNVRDVPWWYGSFGIEDSMDVIMDCIRYIGPEVHVVAVCQPSVTVLAAVAVLSMGDARSTPKSMTLMGGPIDTRINPTAVNDFAASHSLERFERNISLVPFPHLGMLRRVYPGFLQLAGFMSMNMGRHMEAHGEMFNRLVDGDGEGAAATRVFYKEYTAVMDLTAEFYLGTVKCVFKEHLLPLGRFPYRGGIVDPCAIERTPCMVVEGEFDDVCGVGQTKAAHQLLRGLTKEKKAYYLQRGVGHYGVFNGQRFRKEAYPKIRSFISCYN